MIRLAAALLICLACFCQDPSAAEQQALSQALNEAGSSPMELIRALENHLVKFPMTSRRVEIERALVKAAVETNDDRRIVLYGERALSLLPDDLQVLDRVARSLLVGDAKETSERALKYAQHYEQLVTAMRDQPAQAGLGQGQWQEELDRGSARALSLQARATGNLGDRDRAILLAKQAYSAFPTPEAAREIARWLTRSEKETEAIPYLADAFTLDDAKDRAADRMRLGELYRKLKGSEKGLGDVMLAAFDRIEARAVERRSRLALADPNIHADKVLEFTLSGPKGAKLPLDSLRGKAIVFDFWATWCGPCRAQHPLYEEVKARYRFNPDVVFLAVNTDEDRSIVEPFLKEQKWNQMVYFEDGIARKLSISSIPTTLVVNRAGEIVSRMNGFVPARFVDMLSERIEEALK